MSRRRSVFAVLTALAMIAGLLAAWSSGKHLRITQAALLAAIDRGRAPDILDVRTTNEYERGHIPGALRIPYHAVWLHYSEIAAAVDGRPIVVYCSHGVRAAFAMAQLWALGFRDVLYLQGQMRGWERNALPVQSGSQP